MYIHLFYIQKYHLYTHKRPENIRKKNDNGGFRYILCVRLMLHGYSGAAAPSHI